mgnify:CR=1 FL=1
MELVQACLRIIWECQYRILMDTQKLPPLKFWVMENPDAMLSWFLGKPAAVYSPHQFGDKYQKRTCLWGDFNMPESIDDWPLLKYPKFDRMASKDIAPEHFGTLTRTERRSVCSPKFAKAFFEANR